MNNLHRELAPISATAWASIEESQANLLYFQETLTFLIYAAEAAVALSA
jgi:uncharacterized linocin/CFP29 family protein